MNYDTANTNSDLIALLTDFLRNANDHERNEVKQAINRIRLKQLIRVTQELTDELNRT